VRVTLWQPREQHFNKYSAGPRSTRFHSVVKVKNCEGPLEAKKGRATPEIGRISRLSAMVHRNFETLEMVVKQHQQRIDPFGSMVHIAQALPKQCCESRPYAIHGPIEECCNPPGRRPTEPDREDSAVMPNAVGAASGTLHGGLNAGAGPVLRCEH